MDRSLFGSNRDKIRSSDRDRGDRQRGDRGDRRLERGPSKDLLVAGPNAYKRVDPSSREEQLPRTVQSHLNKIAPDTLDVIAKRIVDTAVASSEELKVVISLIMKKALSEPHYCETY